MNRFYALIAFSLSLSLVACGPYQPSGFCTTASDCMGDEVCREGSCSQRLDNITCTDHSECPSSTACNVEQKKCSPVPSYTRIRIEDAMIGPATASGELWDSNSSISPETLNKLGELLAKAATKYYGLPDDFGTGAILGELLNFLVGLSAPPDPVGYAEIISGAPEAPPITLASTTDRFNPKWEAGWDTVPFNRDLRIRIVLEDDDSPCIIKTPCNDALGTIILNFSHLTAAYWKGEVVQLKVAGQTKNHVLFIGYSVSKQ